MTADKIIHHNGFIQVQQVSPPGIPLEFNSLRKSAPDQIIADRNFFSQFPGVFQKFLVYKRPDLESDITTAELVRKLSGKKFRIGSGDENRAIVQTKRPAGILNVLGRVSVASIAPSWLGATAYCSSVADYGARHWLVKAARKGSRSFLVPMAR